VGAQVPAQGLKSYPAPEEKVCNKKFTEQNHIDYKLK